MRFLLSIKTVFPKPGGKVWYDDQREVHRQIFEGDETIDYAFMGEDPDAADNAAVAPTITVTVPSRSAVRSMRRQLQGLSRRRCGRGFVAHAKHSSTGWHWRGRSAGSFSPPPIRPLLARSRAIERIASLRWAFDHAASRIGE
jgi:hypothetical protein